MFPSGRKAGGFPAFSVRKTTDRRGDAKGATAEDPPEKDSRTRQGRTGESNAEK